MQCVVVNARPMFQNNTEEIKEAPAIYRIWGLKSRQKINTLGTS
jgi:hypothetical protein